jgi:hypothetical protein
MIFERRCQRMFVAIGQDRRGGRRHRAPLSNCDETAQQPPFNAELERYCESSPGEIFAAFAGAALHMPPAGNDEALAIGYLFLLQRLLENLRYRADRDYADAAKLIADFQADLIRQVKAGQIDARMLALVGGALHQSGIPASPELAAVSAQHAVDQTDGPLPADIRAALSGILAACEGDPFMVVGSLLETAHAMPVEARCALAGALALAGSPAARGAAVLFLLDPSPAVRRAIAAGLAQVAASLTPTDVRRLIAARNWRPESERTEVDAVIRKARAAGIECAQWEAGSVEAIAATAVDGAATQGFLLVSPAGRKRRISSILVKEAIADAWIGEPESRRWIEATLASSGMAAPTLAVSRSYLDRIVAHHLALGVEKGETPPLGLLQVAETIGGADWQPLAMTFSETLAGLISEVPKTMLEPAALASVLRESGDLTDIELIAQSWFEDDPEVRRALGRAGRGSRAKLANYLLQSILARRRDKWAALILRSALWMREATAEADLCWRELAIVAKALADGRDMAEIGLMRDIALRTIAVLTDPRPKLNFD